MIQIVLISHSELENNPQIPKDYLGLSSKGIEILEKLKSKQELSEVEVFYTNPSAKTLETAMILSSDTGVDIKPEEDLSDISSDETPKQAVARFNEIIEKIIYQEYRETQIATIGIVSSPKILELYISQFDKNHERISVNTPDFAVLIYETKTIIKGFGL